MWNSLKCITDFNVNLLDRMLADIPSTDMCRQPPGLPNHPTWILGHLTFVRLALVKQTNGDASSFPDQWSQLFSRGSMPCSEVDKYPSKQELWSAFTKLHGEAMDRVTALSAEQLAGAHTIESLKGLFPTLGDLVLQMLTSHDGLHIGQLSDWRRSMGYPRVM